MRECRVENAMANTLSWVLERYFELLKDAKVRGYLFEQQNYFEKEGGER